MQAVYNFTYQLGDYCFIVLPTLNSHCISVVHFCMNIICTADFKTAYSYDQFAHAC